MKWSIQKIKALAQKVLEQEQDIDIPNADLDDMTDFSKISVQDLYRPVRAMGEKNIPDIPDDDVNSEEYLWWYEQIKRCLKGWIAPNGVYLNGYVYFYLNFCWIPLGIEGTERFEWLAPLYRDNDHDIMDQLWANTYRSLPNGKMKNAKNHIEGKPRGIAWTTFTLLGVGMWTFVFKNDKEIGCAYPSKSSMDTEREWFIEAWNRLHPMFKRWEGKDLKIIENNQKFFGVGFNRGKSNKKINRCRFDVIGVDTKAGVYKSKRMNLMIAAEAGLWVGESLRNYITENEPSVKLGDDQWGMILVGGTSNLIINNSTAYREIFVKHEAYNMTRHFTPKTMVLRGCIDYFTGKSDKVKALAQIMASRNAKAGDEKGYQQELMENPLIWEEAFIPSDKVSAYNSAPINEQLTKIRIERLDRGWVRGKIFYRKDKFNRNIPDQVYFQRDEPGLPEADKGSWYMNLEGKPNRMYKDLHVAAIDDKYKTPNVTKRTRSSDSRNCMIIWRKPTSYPIKSDMPCAVYYGIASDLTLDYEEFYKGMLLYDVGLQQTLYEYNAEGFIMFMRDYKKDIQRLYHIDGRPGIKVDNEHVKSELTFLGHKFLADERHRNVTFPAILESMLLWGGLTNTDIGSALHLIFKILELTSESFITAVRNHDDEQSSPTIILGPNRYSKSENASPISYVRLGPNS